MNDLSHRWRSTIFMICVPNSPLPTWYPLSLFWFYFNPFRHTLHCFVRCACVKWFLWLETLDAVARLCAVCGLLLLLSNCCLWYMSDGRLFVFVQNLGAYLSDVYRLASVFDCMSLCNIIIMSDTCSHLSPLSLTRFIRHSPVQTPCTL